MSPVPSPCIRNCCYDSDRDYCLGCYRTMSEIVAWGPMPDPERREVLERCAVRQAAASELP